VAYAAAIDATKTDTAVDAANAVIAAKLALYDCLIGAGWTPSGTVVDEIANDKAILRAGLGAIGG
jgi:hypothetical protein